MSRPDDIAPRSFDRPLSASEHIAATIQQHIHRRGFAPGDRLGTEEQLAREFGVSRPTLREGLRLLASSHLVRSSQGPGGGIFVASTPEQGKRSSVSHAIAMMLDAESVSLDELLEARRILEVPLAGIAAKRATRPALDQLAAAIELAVSNPHDERAQRESDQRFHRTLASLCGNRIVEAVTDWAFEVLEPRLKARVAPVVDDAQIVRQHRRILAAIEARDADAAEKAMAAHLKHIATAMSQVAAAEK